MFQKYIVQLFVMALPLSAMAGDVTGLNVDADALSENLTTCPVSLQQTKAKDIDLFREKSISDVSVYLAGSFMTKYTEFSRSESCTKGLLKNAVQILSEYIRVASPKNYNVIGAKLALAEAKMMQAASLPPQDQVARYVDADKLVAEYLAQEVIDPKGEIAPPSYFAAHAYLNAAKVADEKSKILLLDKAIDTVRSERSTSISSTQKNLLLEPIGIAFGEKAKTHGRGTPAYKAVLTESSRHFQEGFESGDKLAAYNLAVNASLLEDSTNAKAWLLKIAEVGGMDKQVCIDGLAADPDLAWFRQTESDWLKAFFRRHCLAYLPKR